jgi:hypothetical protein
MPGGLRDSSKTRVAPVFDRLNGLEPGWVRTLLSLATHRHPVVAIPATADFSLLEGYWGPTERGLDPPVSLLSWLVRNLTPPVGESKVDARRQLLLQRDPATVATALRLLRTDGNKRAWYVFEGQTFPDALLVTPDALVVVEGKRTEPGPTESTTWMSGRHQIWRHVDAAWEVRGHRRVFGMFIVEGDETGAVPPLWRAAVQAAIAPETLATSFPHRGAEERDAIAQCFLGVTTWQRVCAQFGIDYSALPDTVVGDAPIIGRQSPMG